MSEVASEYEGEIKKARFLSRVCVRTIDHAVSSVRGRWCASSGRSCPTRRRKRSSRCSEKARRVIDGINRAAKDLGIDDES